MVGLGIKYLSSKWKIATPPPTFYEEHSVFLVLGSTWWTKQLKQYWENKWPTFSGFVWWLTSECGWVRVTLMVCPLSWPRMWLFKLYWLLKVFSQPSLGQLNGFSPTEQKETLGTFIGNETKKWMERNSFKSLIFTVSQLYGKKRMSLFYRT